MTVDAEQLLVVQSSKHLAKSCLSTASLSNQQYWFIAFEAFVNENGKPFELLTDDQSRDSKSLRHSFESLVKLVLLKVLVIEVTGVDFASQGGFNSLLDELLVFRVS